MGEYFNAGQIVPKRLNMILAGHKKVQAGIVFNARVYVEGRTITALDDRFSAIVVRHFRRKRKNGTFQQYKVVESNVTISNFTIEPPTRGGNHVGVATGLTEAKPEENT